MKKILGGTIVLLITAAMILTSFAVAADTNPLQKSTIIKTSVDNTQIKDNLNRADIIWDNGGIDGLQNGLSSQLDTAYPFNSQTADDFKFQGDATITDVHWWGIFWNGPPEGPNPADFNIIFYADAGGMPTGAGMPDPTPTALKVYTIPQVMGVPAGGTEEYEYDVVLPEPFAASANTIYWIAIQWKGDFPPQWGWDTNGDNPQKLSTSVQGFPLLQKPYWTDHTYGDMAFYLTGDVVTPPKPDLYCEGSLTLKVKAGGIVNGTFQLCNGGEDGSLLNWQFDSAPTWPGAIFEITPDSGTGLAKGDCVTITVQVTAPPDKKKTFTGKIKMINADDPTDYCEVDITLTTPRERTGFNILQWILEKYPNMFPVLRHILA